MAILALLLCGILFDENEKACRDTFPTGFNKLAPIVLHNRVHDQQDHVLARLWELAEIVERIELFAHIVLPASLSCICKAL